MQNKVNRFNNFKNRLKENLGSINYTFNTEYKNNNTKMEVTCMICNHNFSVTPGNILNACRKGKHYCPECARLKSKKENNKGLQNYINNMINTVGKFNYIVDENDWVKMKHPMKHICKICNHEFLARPNNILTAAKKGKHYCPSCNNMVRDERPYEERLKEHNPNIINLEPYIKLSEPILHRCLVCKHEWRTAPSVTVNQKSGCPRCKNINTKSKGENEVLDFIKTFYNGEIIQGSRKILPSTRELDIYIPELKIAIEYCGLYWHNEDHKGKKYHLEKLNECNNNEIRLITIFEDEWINKPNIVKNKIKHIMGLSNKSKIYARNCKVIEINTDIKNKFLDKYHIQGSDRSSIRLGLVYEKKLIAVMTFCKPRVSLGQKDTKYDFELSRFASSYNYIIIGGFSKILKYFERNYEWNSLITYADLRWSNGDVYEKNNWIFSHNSQPNYWYVHKTIDKYKRHHRFKFRKQVLKKLFNNYDDKLTEKQIMKINNYYPIYDCGNKVYYYKK